MDLKIRREQLVAEHTKGQETVSSLTRVILNIEGAIALIDEMLKEAQEDKYPYVGPEETL